MLNASIKHLHTCVCTVSNDILLIQLLYNRFRYHNGKSMIRVKLMRDQGVILRNESYIPPPSSCPQYIWCNRTIVFYGILWLYCFFPYFATKFFQEITKKIIKFMILEGKIETTMKQKGAVLLFKSLVKSTNCKSKYTQYGRRHCFLLIGLHPSGIVRQDRNLHTRENKWYSYRVWQRDANLWIQSEDSTFWGPQPISQRKLCQTLDISHTKHIMKRMDLIADSFNVRFHLYHYFYFP